nr:hypothetical protein [Tanacetum cinerariifolium]
MFKEHKLNNSKLYSNRADKRRTSLNKVVPIQMKEMVLNKGDEEETRQEEEESFDPIPRTPEESEEESNDEEEQDLRLRVESIFTTTSSPIVSLQTPTPIMTPSTIATITTSSEAPVPPPTVPSIILENLPTFNSAFHFEERL